MLVQKRLDHVARDVWAAERASDLVRRTAASSRGAQQDQVAHARVPPAVQLYVDAAATFEEGLRDDEAPLMNRATQSQLEPGSTIKPVVGLSAISEHLPEGLTVPCSGR